MDFRKKLKTRLHIAIAYIFIGIIFSALHSCGVSENQYILSLGIVLIIVGILRIRQYMKTTKDDESIRKQQIAETDERNIAISNRARGTAFAIYIYITSIAVIVLEVLSKSELAQVLAWSVCALVFIYWLSYWIIRKKS